MNKEAITRHPISEAARKRWSPRAFKDQPVEKEKLIGLLEILNPIRKTEAKGATGTQPKKPRRYCLQREIRKYIAIGGGVK